jgi:precorrin-8X/cobalt-precorrin-8 methylmutase
VAREVALRMLYAAGDADLADLLHVSDDAIAAGLRALASGAPLVADVKMVAVALDRQRAQQLGVPVLCAIDDPRVQREAAATGLPRAAVAIRRLVRRAPTGIYVVGNAPTALLQLLDLVDLGVARPALVIATPLGFVAATEAKEELVARALPCITVRGTRGGSAVAAAAANALLRMATRGLAGTVDGGRRIEDAAPSASQPPVTW